MFIFPTIRNNLKVKYVPVDMVIFGDFNFRSQQDNDNSLKHLSQNVKDYGVLKPILVRKLVNDMYEVVSGHRRFLAAKNAGLISVPVIIIDQESEKKLLIYYLSENIYHKDLDFFEEADVLFKLIYEHGFTQEMILECLGVSQSFVTSRLQILKVGFRVRERVRECELTIDQVMLISNIDKEIDQLKVIDEIVRNKLNIDQLKILVDKINNRELNILSRPKFRSETVYIVKDVRLFDNAISEAIDVMNKSGVGASSVKNECDECIEYIIKIPKDKIFIKKSVGF